MVIDEFLVPKSKALLTVAEVAERLECPLNDVKRLLKSGQIAHMPGYKPLVEVSDLQAYIDIARPDLNRDGDGGGCLSLQEVARRLGRPIGSIETFLRRGGARLTPERPPKIQEREFWDFLIEARYVRRSAFGAEPLKPGAETAFAAAVERVIGERLAELKLDEERARHRSEVAVERATARAEAQRKREEERAKKQLRRDRSSA